MKIGFGSFTFDTDTRELLEAGARVHLSPRAFDVLRVLLERRPNVVSKRDLHDHVWQDTFVSDANLSVVVAEIRQVLREDSRQARFVRTVHRVGYAFSGEATDLAVAVAASGAAVAAAAGRQPCWVVRNDQSYPLVAGENLVGRDPRCAVWIDASGVSRRHANIEVADGVATITDLESSNGTFVGGQRVDVPRRLHDGDVIELGAATIVFRSLADGSGARTERITRR
ncbi:MAG TPA: FHA domain-containing protein [Luteitalea sp.]|nr:FHA domain-containing protein [Luteitalea sp.]